MYDKMKAKIDVIGELLQLQRQYPGRWQEFVSLNPAAASSGSVAMMNRPIGEIQSILNGFKEYLDKNSPDSINDTSEQQPAAPNLSNIHQL